MRIKKFITISLVILTTVALLTSCGKATPPSDAQEVPSTEAIEEVPTPEVSEEVPEDTKEISSTDVIITNEGREVPSTMVLPAGDGPFPMVVMNHGFAGSRQEGGGFEHLANTLATNGIASIRMDFSGCGDSKSSFKEFNNTNNISDSNASLAWALQNANIDENRLGILGYSNGGRLSIIITAQENSPYKAMGLLAAAAFPSTPESIAADEAKLAEATEKGNLTMEWFGNELELGAKMYEDNLRDYKYLDNAKSIGPTLIVYGEEDVMVTPEICTAFAEKVGAETVAIKGAEHSFGFYSEQPDITKTLEDAFVEFFKTNL